MIPGPELLPGTTPHCWPVALHARQTFNHTCKLNKMQKKCWDWSHVEMGLWHLHLSAHGLGFAGVFAIDVGLTLSKENLVVFAFPAKRKSTHVANGVLISPKSRGSPIKSNYIGSLSNHQCLFPKVNSLRQNCVLRTESGSIAV